MALHLATIRRSGTDRAVVMQAQTAEVGHVETA
jgi:hypothetical protein